MQRKSIPICLFIMMLVSSVALGQQKPAQAAVEQWRADLRYLAEELPKRHYNLFYPLAREQFEQAVKRLDERIPSLNPQQIFVEMLRIVAKVEDGHTLITKRDTQGFTPRRYPLTLYLYPDGLLVQAAAAGGQDDGRLADECARAGGGDYVLGFVIQGLPPLPPGAGQSTNFYSVSAGYFKAMGIPLRRGRLFTERGAKDSPHVVVINETLAKKIFPDEDPIGKRITFDGGENNPDWYEIVGIVGDVKQYGLDQATTLQTYEPHTQQPSSAMTLVVRTAGDLTNFTAAIRNAVLQLDKEQPISSIRPLTQFLSTSIAQQQFSMLLLGVFAAVALVLAAVGIYGVLSYAVTQRTHEIGIRMALGAGQRDVLKLVVGDGLRLTLLGVAAGLAAAFALTRLMSTLLFGVSTTDPLTFAGIALLLTLAALVACWRPARRATKVDPMIALRCE